MKLALKPIVERLKAAKFRNVEGLLEFSRQTTAPRALPALFVVPTGEQAGDNANVGARDQAVDVGVSVMLVLDGARRDSDGVSEELKVQSGLAIDALTGWTHPEASRPWSYSGGRLASADGSTVVWEIRFKTRWHLRKAN